MNKERKIADLNNEEMKKHPFTVPEGYFDTFSGRLKERIETEKHQYARSHRLVRLRVALAAAVVVLALVTWPVIRLVDPGSGNGSGYAELALLEEAGYYLSDYELAEYLDGEDEVLDEDEAYVAQAIEYLAMNDVEMDLIFE